MKLTSLGSPLVEQGTNAYSIDLTDLRLFTGLSVIARMMADEILEQVELGDIVVQRRLIPEINPELCSLGLSRVILYARSGVLQAQSLKAEFHTDLRTVFGTLQRPNWGGLLFPEFFQMSTQIQALIFPFHLHSEKEDLDYFFLVERLPKEGLLRITVENPRESRLDLRSISPITVDDLDRRTYLQGLTKVAEAVYQGVLKECEANRSEYSESPRRNLQLFDQLERAGIPCSQAYFRWPLERSDFILRARRWDAVAFLKKVFLVFEDREVVDLLKQSCTIEVKSGEVSAFIDLSQRMRCVNISIAAPRSISGIEYYLERMPVMEKVAKDNPGSLRGHRVFLIHHITSEILGTIEALNQLEAEHITVLFVKYAGSIPPDYLETLLSLPRERYDFVGLQKVETEDHVEGYYVLSKQYFDLDAELNRVDEMLQKKRLNFYSAMKEVAGSLFLTELAETTRVKKKMLLIEDGGYLAPQLHEFILEKKSMRQVIDILGGSSELIAELKKLGIPSESEFAKVANDYLVGSVEHTRNGYDKLLAVKQKFSSLAFPSGSIAISKLKREKESREISVSILHAIESVMHGMGAILSERNVLLLGSMGAIGTHLTRDLTYRLKDGLVGIDLSADSTEPNSNAKHYPSLEHIPFERLLEVDVVLGVVGKSLLTKNFLEKWLGNTPHRRIFFVSGSTKTAEFTDLSVWLDEVHQTSKFGNEKVKLGSRVIRDPQSSMIQGTNLQIEFLQTGRRLDLLLLGGLTPINFLYYGAPTEAMDGILAQLLSVSVGIVKNRANLPNDLLAVDHEIDDRAELLRR